MWILFDFHIIVEYNIFIHIFVEIYMPKRRRNKKMAEKRSKKTVVEQQAEVAESVNAKYRDFVIPERFSDPRTFVVAGVTYLDSYKDRNTGVKVVTVESRLPDPFGDPDFIDVSIMPKWANSGGLFRYRSKKALREVSKIEYPVIVTPVTFYSKKAKKELTIAGLFIKNPFDEGYIEFHVHVRGGANMQEDAAVFSSLVSARWNVLLDELPGADEDVEE